MRTAEGLLSDVHCSSWPEISLFCYCLALLKEDGPAELRPAQMDEIKYNISFESGSRKANMKETQKIMF
jgi:hypothetical protein